MGAEWGPMRSNVKGLRDEMSKAQSLNAQPYTRSRASRTAPFMPLPLRPVRLTVDTLYPIVKRGATDLRWYG